jgi:acyl CoA:acetate/3-ketoacid CoA transferase beta subunit
MASQFHEIRRVISNLAVLDFETPDHAMRVRSVHPGVTINEVTAATGFALVVPPDLGETRAPSDDELRLIREVLDPDTLRNGELPA